MSIGFMQSNKKSKITEKKVNNIEIGVVMDYEIMKVGFYIYELLLTLIRNVGST